MEGNNYYQNKPPPDDWRLLQAQYDAIYSFFKTTTEPYDELDWDGSCLIVWLGDDPNSPGYQVERYSLADLTEIIKDFPLRLDDVWWASRFSP